MTAIFDVAVHSDLASMPLSWVKSNCANYSDVDPKCHQEKIVKVKDLNLHAIFFIYIFFLILNIYTIGILTHKESAIEKVCI
jgi:hypothetical protein